MRNSLTSLALRQSVMPKATYKIRSKVWLYEGVGGWHFITLSVRQSATIQALFASQAKPFGSIAVSALIGNTRWKSSLFPVVRLKQYLLPIKAEVRKKEKVALGDTVTVTIDIL